MPRDDFGLGRFGKPNPGLVDLPEPEDMTNTMSPPGLESDPRRPGVGPVRSRGIGKALGRKNRAEAQARRAIKKSARQAAEVKERANAAFFRDMSKERAGRKERSRLKFAQLVSKLGGLFR